MKRVPGILGITWLLAVATIWTLIFGWNAWQSVWVDWPISLTMFIGAFISGATPEGGGAVAFPVFTKVLGFTPHEASAFSYLIQSVGMGAATLLIYIKKIKVDRLVVSVGCLITPPVAVLSLHLGIPQVLSPTNSKVVFTSFQAALFICLFIIQLTPHRQSYTDMHSPRVALVLIASTFFGGVIVSIFGSGADLFIFACILVGFRTSEKVLTPSSVVIMWVTSCAMSAYTVGLLRDTPPRTADAWMAAAPVVACVAPLGAWACAKASRKTLTRGLMILLVTEVITTLVLLVKTFEELCLLVLVAVGFLGFMGMLLRFGEPYREWALDRENSESVQ